ncbi:MAG TPA: chemotaxis protein CheW [Planctomycetota bacterium]|jgi:purine-binding chemotaxis protein CheW
MPPNASVSGATATVAARAGKYLTFRLAAEEYGLEILKVQEIIGMMKVTRVPQMPPFIRGVINLRGKVIPVIDLRLKFGLQSQTDTERTCIIVVQIAQGDRRVVTGILVDEVSEVLNIAAEQIEPPPSFGAVIATDFILGMGKVAQKVVMLLDIDRVLSAKQIEAAVGVAAVA